MYCEVSWSDRPNWLSNNNRAFQALWAEYNTSPSVLQRPKVLSNNMDDAIDSLMDPTIPGSDDTGEDEYDRWRRSEPRAGKGTEYANNPIKYWVMMRDCYPSLSKLALDVLSIPASSCECERMFSKLGNLLEPRRWGIHPQLLAAIQCVQRWQRSGLGDNKVAMKSAISDKEIDLLYGVSSWYDDNNTSTPRTDTL